MTTNPSVKRSRSFLLRVAILFTALAVPAVAQILAGHSTLFPRWASAVSRSLTVARAHVPSVQIAKQAAHPASAHPNASQPNTSQPGAQIHFVPEVLHVIAGGDDDSRANDDPTDGALATSAHLASPSALAVDSQGNVYVADIGTSRVYRIKASDGTITAVAGKATPTDEVAPLGRSKLRPDAQHASRALVNPLLAHGDSIPGTQVQLRFPDALALGPNGELYIADGQNNAIYKLDTAGNMTVVAGTEGSEGYSPDGTLATSAMLGIPVGVAVDASGRVYFSEAENGVVRRINPADGTLITVAGNQTLGTGFSGDGSAATSAQLNNPAGLAFLPNGTLVIADSANFVVRQVNASTGIITTVAGRNRSGYSGDGGAGTAARLSQVQAVATDAAGQIYIADLDNKVVRKLALDGTISTIAGKRSTFSSPNYGPFDVAATDASITSAAAVAIGPGGELYVAGEDIGIVAKLGPDLLFDFGQQQIHSVITRSLVIENTGTASLTFTGSGFHATGNAYHADSSATNGCTATTTLAPGAVCSIDVTFNPQETGDAYGELTITDSVGTQSATLQGTGVKQYTSTTLVVSPTSANVGDTITFTATVTDQIGNGNPITSGTVLFIDDITGNTLAAAALNSSGVATTTAIPPQGVYQVYASFNDTSQYSGSSSDEVELDIAAKPASITLTASTTTANTGASIAVSATVTSTAGSPTGSVNFLIDGNNVKTAPLTGGNASANIPAPSPGQHTLQAVYTGDSLFGAASSNMLPLTTHGALLQFSPGSAVTIAGIPEDDNHGGYADGGPATSARFNGPNGVAVDSGGNVYIADELNNVIRKVDTTGTIHTIAGIPYPTNYTTTRYGGDGGPATNAYFSNPSAVAVDSAGNLFIADYSNDIVRKVTASTGIISTVAGSAGQPSYNGDSGTATSIHMYHPSALALDSSGNLYITDSGNNLIRKVDTSGNMTTVAGNYSLNHFGPPTSGGSATNTALFGPMGVAIAPDGSIYISDTGYNVIRKVTAGIMTIVAGSAAYAPEADNVLGTASALNSPQQLTVDQAGNLFIAESRENVIRKLDPSGIITTAVGFLGSFSTSFYYFDPAGAPANTFQLVAPSGVAVDPSGNLLVTDNFNQTVIRVGPSGVMIFGPTDDASAPQTLALYNAGDLPLTFGTTPYTVTGNYTISAGSSTPCTGGSLSPGASCTLSVSNNAGTDGSIIFATNASGSGTVRLHTNSTANPTTTEAGLSEQSGAVGDSVLVYGVVTTTSSPASGTIAFYDGTTLLGSAQISSGIAYITVMTFTGGTHSITAHYLGQGLNAPSVSDPIVLTLSQPATSTTLAVSATSPTYGSAVTFTATVSTVATNSVPVTSGSVTFLDGSTALASRALNGSGTAQFTTTSLSPGTHTITASFGGNSANGASSSSAMTVTVSGGGGGGGGNPQGLDYVISLDPLPVVIHRGETKTIGVYGTQLGLPYQGNVTLSCGTLPSYVTCSFSPAVMTFGGPVPNTTSVLTITAAPAAGAGANSRSLHVTASGPNGMPRITGAAAKP